MKAVYWVRGDEYKALAEQSVATVRAVCDAEIDIRTDDGLRPAMVANLDIQIAALNETPDGEDVLFLDADTLMQKPFPFNGADLYPTFRDHVAVVSGEKVKGIAEIMPYNYGVLGVKASPAIREAFYWLRQRILQMTPQYQEWYGNQLALMDLLASPADKTAHIRWSFEDRGTPIEVRCLPCETYNYTPEKPDEDISDKAILHLKGNRKDLFEHYAARIHRV